MIALYQNGQKTPLSTYSDFHVRHTADGNDMLYFSVATNDPQYPLLQEEMRIDAAANEWIIKRIYDDDIACELNLDFLKEKVLQSYTSGSNTLQTILNGILSPYGWSVSGASHVSIRRTITFNVCTEFEIVEQCMNTFDVAFRWDVPNKTLTVVVPSAMPVSGEYLTDELNLRKLSYQGETVDFATRLYAFGKDGLTIEGAQVGGTSYGKKYVDDNSYSSKVVSTYWTDERYTDPTSLYNDAVKRLASIARPVQSYTCDADDLSAKSDEYAFLAFAVHRKLTLIDTARSLRVVHQIVEFDEYPEEPKRSVITLSTVPPTIGSVSQKRLDDATLSASNASLSAIESATALLTGAQGGYLIFHYDSDGKPFEMLIMNTPNEATATKVWRFNQNGWGFSATGAEGPYTLAATMDGSIVADLITAGEMSADRIRGGTLILGGQNNTFGALQIVDESGNVIGTWDRNGLIALGRIRSQTNGSASYTELIGGGFKTYNDAGFECVVISGIGGPDGPYLSVKNGNQKLLSVNAGEIAIGDPDDPTTPTINGKDIGAPTYVSIPKASSFGASSYSVYAYTWPALDLGVVQYNITLPALDAATETLVCNMPVGTRSWGTFYHDIVTRLGNPVLIRTYADGRMTVYSNTAIPAQAIRGTLTFPLRPNQ